MMLHKFFSEYNVIFHSLLIIEMYCFDTKDIQKNFPEKTLLAILGGNVELPCDLTPALPNDNITMVFWFRGSMLMPLYTLDARNSDLGLAHLAISNDLGDRSVFLFDKKYSRANLKIQNIKTEDQGLFRCRVDFVNSPTRNFRINLTLVVQPSVPRIFNAKGKELNQTAGPFLEGEEMFLSCEVTGGNPKPSLVWWHNNTVLDGVIDSSIQSFTTVNQLIVKKIPRYYKGARLECRATSLEKAGYLSRKVLLTVFLRPNKVKIIYANDFLSTKGTESVRCETSGSFPPAQITWLLDGKTARNTVITKEETDFFTISTIYLNVLPEDNEKKIICRAYNPRFPGGSIDDIRKIYVAYPPQLTITMHSSLINSTIVEGSNLSLRCDSLAHPPAVNFSWYLNDHLLPYNEIAGIMPSNNLLYLENIKEKYGGQYACSAFNSEGKSYSKPFELKIYYLPRCKMGYEFLQIGVALSETLVLQCYIDAFPDITGYFWTYNNSRGLFQIPDDQIQNHGNVSVLYFSKNVSDVDMLACWATNSVGKQKTPCLFSIINAEIPQPPKNCVGQKTSMRNELEVICLPGEDGGLKQSFVLEVSEVTASSEGNVLSDQGGEINPIYRFHGDQPIFQIQNLDPAREYQISIYAENAKGKSKHAVVFLTKQVNRTIPVIHLQNEGIHLGSYGTSNKKLIIIGVVLLFVFLLLSVMSVIIIIICNKIQNKNDDKPSEDGENSEDGFGKSFNRRSIQYRASLCGEVDQGIMQITNGPDLIMTPTNTRTQ